MGPLHDSEAFIQVSAVLTANPTTGRMCLAVSPICCQEALNKSA